MSLSSLIVQREVATMRQVEEALARQVIYGGDLVTNLLEVATVDEGVLARLLGESMGLPPAPAGELPAPADKVRALVAPELATQRAIVPLEVKGGKLVLAVAEPMSGDVVEQLAFSLGMGIDQRVASAVRVRQAIARAYGTPLERRVDRLVTKLGGGPARPVAHGSMPPPLGGVPNVPEPPRPLSEAPNRAATPAQGIGAIPLVRRVSSSAPSRRPTAAGFPAVAAPAAEVAAATAAAEGRVGLLQREVGANARAARRRRGPVMLDVARREADEATDRDVLLDLFFDFSRQFFDYAALFLVHGDIAEGRDAFGTGAPRERVLGIGVPLDLPSTISGTREKKATTVVKVAADGLDGVLLADLQRPRDVEVAFVPLIVRTRAVAILVGDCGPVGIDRASIAQVTAFAVHVGKSFERIIVRRKLDGFIAGGPKGGTAGKVDAAVVSQKRPVVPTASSAPPAPSARTTQELVSAQPGKASFAPAASAAAPARQSIRPGPSNAPPPSANIAVLRKIGGPPIPREEPEEESPGVLRAAVALAIEPAPSIEVSAVQMVEAAPEIQATVHDVPEDVQAIFDELAWEPPGQSEGEGIIPEPPPSSSMAVPPHLPPSAQGETTPLPKVIVDMDEDLARLLEKVLAGPDEQAEAELLRQGDRAMAVLMHAFPGPVTMDRARFATMARLPRASECGPVLRLVAHERKVALPAVLERLTDPDPERRGWAVHLLCELAYPEAIPHLLLRLRDPDASTRASAGLALAGVARGWPREVRDAVLALAHAVDPRERAAAMGAMADLRQPALVPELVRALGDGDEVVVTAAHKALVVLTRQDFGADARPWLKWWDQHAGRHRIEWLIDSLTHEVSEIRKAAGEELRSVTKEYFGYASDLPARDRERAKQRYRDWWVTEGKARFARRHEG